MKVDVISIGFSEDQVWFEKNDYEQGELYFEGTCMEPQTREEDYSLQILSDKTEAMTVTVDSIADEARIEWKREHEGIRVENGNSYKFEEEGNYEVRWYATQNNNVTLPSSGGGEEVKLADTALLAGDISMGDRMQTELQKSIIGRDYILKFISSKDSIFGSISKNSENSENINIKDTIFTAQNAGGNGVNGLFAGSISSGVTIENIKLFGTIRNVAYNSSSGDVYVDYKTKTETGTTSIENNASLIGLNNAQYNDDDIYAGSKGDAFTVKLSAHLDADDKVVIIAGDSVKGNNAGSSYNVVEDSYKGSVLATVSLGDSSVRSGSKGYDAAEGGAVVSQTTGDGLIVAGRSAIGGYGGDGANGFFSDNNKAIGGGKAGKAGTGTSSYRIEQFETIKQTYDKNDLVEIEQFDGNPGVGGFGRITGDSYTNFTLYTSGNSGKGTEQSGSNGECYTAKKCNAYGDQASYNCGQYAFFGALKTNLVDLGSLYMYVGPVKVWEISKINVDKWTEEWINNLLNNNGINTKDYSEFGGVSGLGGNGIATGVNTHASKIYLYNHAIILENSWAVAYHYKTYDNWIQVGWMSGEPVNSAGQITFVGGGN